jgi:hypothetical protein
MERWRFAGCYLFGIVFEFYFLFEVSLDPFLVLVQAYHHQTHQTFVADRFVPVTNTLALVKGEGEIANKTTHSSPMMDICWLIKLKKS